VFASCMPRVQLYVNACNGWPQFALQHHWLLPINYHFLWLYSAAGRGIAAVSSAIEESDVYLYHNLFIYSILTRRWLLSPGLYNHYTLPLLLHLIFTFELWPLISAMSHCNCSLSMSVALFTEFTETTTVDDHDGMSTHILMPISPTFSTISQLLSIMSDGFWLQMNRTMLIKSVNGATVNTLHVQIVISNCRLPCY